jgi:hypothetical protein
MSISGVQSNPWPDPSAASGSRAIASGRGKGVPHPACDATGPAEGSFAPSPPTGSWSTQSTAQNGGKPAAGGNPLQTLASDIQAMLIQAQGPVQGNASTTATGASTTSGTTATDSSASVSPAQKLAADLQTFLNNLGANSGGSPSATTGANAAGTSVANATGTSVANASPTDSATQTGHHHHHHHGGEASGASAVAQTSGVSSGAAAAPSGAFASQAVSRVFAGGIAHALRIYANATSAATIPAVTV